MRIVAKQKDYYDCIQATGQDRSLVYVRDYHEEFVEEWPFPEFDDYYLRGDGFSYHWYIIGFCGNIYPAIELYHYWPRPDISAPPPPVVAFSLTEVDAFMEKALKKKQLDAFNEKVKAKSKKPIFGDMRRWHFERFFDDCQKQKGSFRELFEAKRSPVFVATPDHSRDVKLCGRIEWNALLNQWHFACVFPPFQAFQEISMFLGNLAVPQKPMPVISDLDKIATHGFDKHSFRREKGGR